VCVCYVFKLRRKVFTPKVGYEICLCNVQAENEMPEGLFFLPCLFAPVFSIVYIHFSLYAIFRSFICLSHFLVWIRFKYKIHL
uniref:Uncharacterized protein n=1 Tax=Rhinolophus ferrumequinum TaxID=59479 RepID=A0A671DPT8_RHIFE